MKQHKPSTKAAIFFTTIVAVMLIVPGSVMAGSLEPSAPPGPTMKTLDEIPPTWSQKLSAAQRFVIVLDGAAVLDKETGLVWEKSPDTAQRTWSNAVIDAYGKNVGGRKGWRLPRIEELASLAELPPGHPFQNVQEEFTDRYWTSTEDADDPSSAWCVMFIDGSLLRRPKANSQFYYLWAVRGGR
jgi:hypothetical protein